MTFREILEKYQSKIEPFKQDIQDLSNLKESDYSDNLKKEFDQILNKTINLQIKETQDFIRDLNQNGYPCFLYNFNLFMLFETICDNYDKILDFIKENDFNIDESILEDKNIEKTFKDFIKLELELIKQNTLPDETLEIKISKNISLLFNFENTYKNISKEIAYDLITDLKHIKPNYIKTFETDQVITTAKINHKTKEISNLDDALLFKFNIASFANMQSDQRLLGKFINPKKYLPIYKKDFQLGVVGYNQTSQGLNLLSKENQYLTNQTAQNISKIILNLKEDPAYIKKHFSFAIKENVVFVRSSGLEPKINTLFIMRELLYYISKLSKQTTNNLNTIVFDVSKEKYNEKYFKVPFFQIRGKDPKLFNTIKNIESAIDYISPITREELKSSQHLKFQYNDFKKFDKRNTYKKITEEKTKMALNKMLDRDVLKYKKTDIDTKKVYTYLGCEFKLKNNPIIKFKESPTRGIKMLDIETDEDVIIYDINNNSTDV